MRTEIIHCDLCGKTEADKRVFQVIFTTEQNEGRMVPPYLEMVSLDICPSCYKNVLDGNYVYAEGAMGHNKYWFKTTKKR